MRTLFIAALCAGLSFLMGPAWAQDVRGIVERGCLSDGSAPTYCACYADEIADASAAFVEDGAAEMLAILAGGGAAMSQTDLTEVMTSTSPAAQTEAAIALSTVAPAAAARCTEVADAADRAAAADAAAALEDMEGGGRDRFAAVCAATQGSDAEIDADQLCGCMADAMLDVMSDGELDVFATIMLAQAQDQDPIDALAARSGLSRDEAAEAVGEIMMRQVGLSNELTAAGMACAS